MAVCTFSEARKIVSRTNSYFSRNRGKEVSLEKLNEFLSNQLKIENFDVNDYLELPELRNVLTKNNMDFKWTPKQGVQNPSLVVDALTNNLEGLLYNVSAIKNYFEQYVNEHIIKAYFIGDNTTDVYVNSDEQLNKNFESLKNTLFDNIQNFLKDKNLLKIKNPSTLLTEGVINDYDYYKSVMTIMKSYFYNSGEFDLVSTASGKFIPNFNDDVLTNLPIYKAFSDFLFLSNFDSVINTYYKDIISLDFKQYGGLDSNLDNSKYKSEISPNSITYWKTSSHIESSVEKQKVKLLELLTNAIPLVNKNRQPSPYYMRVNDLYLIGAKIADFELKYGNFIKNKLNHHKDLNFDYFGNDPKNNLIWYVNEIVNSLTETGTKSVINDLTQGALKNTFNEYSDLIYSLQNFFNDGNLNIQSKEKNSEISLLSILGQSINNSFGAIYAVSDPVKGLIVHNVYDQNFNTTRLQTSVFNHMKSNSNETDFYNINELSKEVDNIFKNPNYYTRFGTFINSKLGIYLDSDAVKKVLDNFNLNTVKKIEDLKAPLIELLKSANSDFKSKDFRNIVNESDFSKIATADEEVSKILPNLLKDPLFKSIIDVYLIDFPARSLMNIKTLSGESIPAFNTSNLTFKDVDLFDIYRNNKKENSIFNSLLVNDKSVILGTSIRLEATNKNKNKPADKLTPIESFISDIRYEFLDNLVNNNKYNVIIGNYSDKSRILSKVIDADGLYDPYTGEPIHRESIDYILNLVRTQSRNYHFDALRSVLQDYKILFDSLNINFKIPEINNINTSTIEGIINKLNDFLQTINIIDLINLNPDIIHKNNLRFQEELHYSKYSNGVFLNNDLINSFKIFNDNSLFKSFVSFENHSFAHKYNIIGSTMKNADFLMGASTSKVKSYLNALNIKESDYTPFKKIIFNEKGEMNPIIEKWMWLNALIRNEYLFISTKGQYMHPHKNNSTFDNKFKSNKDILNDFISYSREREGRLITMSKRNVSNTSLIDVPVRNSLKGITPKIKIAAMDDFGSDPYSITGDKKYNYNEGVTKGFQDAHDGSSFINYYYSKMIDNSYPGKGYSGTKKQFGTILTEHGIIVKKDAESVITNLKMRQSGNTGISFVNLHKKLLSIPIKGVNYTQEYSSDYFYRKGSDIYSIDKIELTGNNANVSIRKKNGDTWGASQTINRTFNNIYDLWKIFGGMYSSDVYGKFNEGSNDIVYEIITSPENQFLKDSMIHVISNKSALKSGATNLNTSDKWTNDNQLLYAEFDNKLMGPQLDASKDTDESQVKEVTQVMSALAQGGYTSDIARQAYDDVAKIVKISADKYNNYIKSDKRLYKYLSNNFMKALLKSKSDNIAKVLVDELKKDNIEIPFSNPNFFNLFVKDVITQMNGDFITRYYPGMGGILVPSHKIIELYDIYDENNEYVESVSYNEIINRALNANISNVNPIAELKYNNIPELSSAGTIEQYSLFTELNPLSDLDSVDEFSKFMDDYNDHLVNYYISKNQRLINVDISDIEIGDTITIGEKIEGQWEYTGQYEISNPDEYYDLKENLRLKKEQNDNLKFFKDTKAPRDLKPTLHTFELNGTKFNVFDLESVKLKFYLDRDIKPEMYSEVLNKLEDYVNSLNKPITVKQFLNLWTQRDLALMEKGLITNTVFDPNNPVDFNQYFANDNLLKNTLNDVLSYYQENGLKITNIRFRPAEIIMGNIFKSRFMMSEEDSISKVRSLKEDFFKSKLKEYFDNTIDDDSSLKIYTSRLSEPIYVKFVFNYNMDPSPDVVLDDETGLYTRYNSNNSKVYHLPKETSVIRSGDKEIILVKVASKGPNNSNFLKKGVNQTINDLISSFGDTIQAIIPSTKNNSINIFTGKDESGKRSIEKFDLKEYSDKAFRKFYKLNTSTVIDDDNIINIIDNISKQMYASWEKSLDVIASRIPAQSMQSFMPMRIVEYNPDSKNDIYVPISQIFLQGSDFR